MTTGSLWHSRHPAPPTSLPDDGSTHLTPLEGHCEVAVVGAGLAGVTTALLLARAGRTVTLVEATGLGAGTTGSSTAKLSLLQGTRLSTIRRVRPDADVARYVEANREAQAWVLRFCERHGVETQRRDAYTFAWDAQGAASARSEHEIAERHGLDTAWVEEPPLPFATAGAVRLPDQAQLDPLALLDALLAEAVLAGVRFVTGHRVRAVTGSAPVQVRAELGVLTADAVVVATGMPILDRGGFFARMRAHRSYGLAFDTPAPAVEAMFLSADQPSRSLRDADDGATLLVGGEGHPTGHGGSTRLRLGALRAWTHEHFPDAVETHAWSAQDHTPERGLPYAGPVRPGRDDVLVVGGFAKWGMTNAVAAALAVTARLTGGSMPWATAFDPWRGELTALPRLGAANARVGLDLAGGWVRPFLTGAGDAPGDPAEGEGRIERGPLAAPVAIARDGGVTRTLSGVCTHLGGVVHWNDAERSWDCPLHGSRFASDGSVLDAPATCGLAALTHRPVDG